MFYSVKEQGLKNSGGYINEVAKWRGFFIRGGLSQQVSKAHIVLITFVLLHQKFLNIMILIKSAMHLVKPRLKVA